MQQYSDGTLRSLVELLQKGMQKNHEPLQIAVLSLIGTIADVIREDFQQYFNDFIPMLTQLLTTVQPTTMEAKKFRAKVIETIGSIIISVTDAEKEPFKPSVLEIT